MQLTTRLYGTIAVIIGFVMVTGGMLLLMTGEPSYVLLSMIMVFGVVGFVLFITGLVIVYDAD